MAKFDNSEQQLETCITMFNPLDINIDVKDDVKINKQISKAPNAPSEEIWESAIDNALYTEKTTEISVSLECPKFAEDPKNIEVIFDVYLISKVGVKIADSVTSPYGTVPANIKTFNFSYKLPIQSQEIQNTNNSGRTFLKTITKKDLLNYYRLVLAYIKNHGDELSPYNKPSTEALLRELKNPRIYAMSYIIIDNKIKKGNEEITVQSIRPDIAMQKYKLDEQSKTDYDDFMLECVKKGIKSELKDKVYFFKKYQEITEINLIKEFKGQNIPAQNISKSDNSLFQIKNT
ncbi:hypothetical protein [Francisella sp. SYW-2]|uniref:hypothetical protein n=1 Tax=Francisella sp. SYW-2 TaxID=2610886 RepID=UPI00123D1EEC|nr:hypothetical protein [Francisella sp. SYW-2]